MNAAAGEITHVKRIAILVNFIRVKLLRHCAPSAREAQHSRTAAAHAGNPRGLREHVQLLLRL